MNILYPIPVAIYATLAFLFLIFSRRAGGLKCFLVASYCGVMVTSFTGGASGGIWLAPLFLFLLAVSIIRRPKTESFRSSGVTKVTYMFLTIFLIGIIIGWLRYDESVAFFKAGRYAQFGGIPLSFLITMYRLHVLLFLFLAFSLPLHYYIDRDLLLRCLTLCWFFTTVLALAGVIDYFGVLDLSFDYRIEFVYGRVAILGFRRVSNGHMLATGILMSFAMTQMTRSFWLKLFAYASAPLLIFALLLSFSRSSILMLGVAAMILTLTIGGMRIFKGILITTIGILIGLIIISQVPLLQERFGFIYAGGLERGIGTPRLILWKNLLNWLPERPDVLMFGVGFQNFHYYINLKEHVVNLDNAHNNFLQILTEFGVIGLFIFLAWVASIFKWLVVWHRETPDRDDRTVAGIFMALILGLFSSCLFGSAMSPSFGSIAFQIHLYLLLGICISYYRARMTEIYTIYEYEHAGYHETYGYGLLKG